MLMKRLACLLLVLAMTCLAAGCRWQKQAERQDWKEIEEKGVLRIGVTECAPFSQKGADGSWSGFDMDLARSVCRQLGLEPEFVELDWSGRVEALNQGEVDCHWSGITARSDLLETLDFTQTYLASRPALVIRWDEVEQYQTAEQLKGKTVAVEAGSAGQSAALACLPDVSVASVGSQKAALEEVQKGLAQGAVVDHLVAQAAVEAHRELTVQTRVELGTEELAVALPHDSDLTGRLNRALSALQEDGTLDTLAEQYGLTGGLISG